MQCTVLYTLVMYNVQQYAQSKWQENFQHKQNILLYVPNQISFFCLLPNFPLKAELSLSYLKNSIHFFPIMEKFRRDEGYSRSNCLLQATIFASLSCSQFFRCENLFNPCRLVETFLLVAEAARQGRQLKQLDHRLRAAFTSAASKFRPLADQLQVGSL